MDTLGIATLTMGTTNLNNIPMGSNYTLAGASRSLGIPTAFLERTLKRGVLTLEGDLGGTWSWNAYYQRGEVIFYQETTNNHINANYNLAVDAVAAPAGNALGVAAGTPVCRSTLTNPTNGCSPLNIFGYGVASQAAIDYINVKPGQNYQHQKLTQEVFAASMQGTLPFGLPAGDIAVAFGAEHRMEKGETQVDPGNATATSPIYAQGNFAPFFGKYTVKEAFLEAEVPLLKDSVIDRLSFNAAGRVTDYSTSGRVTTWKFGLTGQVNADIAFRGTISRDIRAPILNELFSKGVATSGSAVDPNTGRSEQIFTFASGNPNLRPEVAKTYSGGIILSPDWLPHFTMSVDYYNISIKDAIASVNATQVLSRCVAGETAFCGQLVFAGANGALSQINTFPLNVASLDVDGLDFQADYSHPLFAGQISAHLVGNYILHQSQVQLGTKIDYAGAIGPDNPVSGVPRARVNGSISYDQGPLSLTTQVRFIGAAKLVSTWTAKDVDRNKISPIAYVDLRASYKLTKDIQIFGNIDNLFNQEPPVVAGTSSRGQTVYYYTAVRGDIYDLLGRSVRGGVRVTF
jgi:outer membrane receptor protein involved in Fe transport